MEKKSVQLIIFTVGKTRIEQFPLDLEVIAGYDAKFTCSGSTDFDEAKNMVVSVFIPPANFVCRGYTVFTLSVRASVRPSVRNALFP